MLKSLCLFALLVWLHLFVSDHVGSRTRWSILCASRSYPQLGRTNSYETATDVKCQILLEIIRFILCQAVMHTGSSSFVFH